MTLTIDIDTGGTFTDGVFTRDGVAHGVKVLTTPHDLTVGMLECIDAGAGVLGLPVQEMLREALAVRFSSTIATNAILERRGPAIGLIVSAGAEHDLYGAPLVEAGIVRPELVAGVATPVDLDATRVVVERLLDGGARALVVSLDGSWHDPGPERAVRAAVRSLYPPYYLGAVRVFLASELSALPGAAERTGTAALNAFVHDRLARSIYRVEEELRRRGLRHPLLLVHGHAGLARSAKTLAVHTYNSGPVAGVRGAAAATSDLGKVAVTLDIGGTSADVSLAESDGSSLTWTGSVGLVPTHVPSVPVDALPIGGGSIAWADGAGLQLGPRSAGAHPGPACFDRGGAEATLTDANLLLGLLDADAFHGGRLPLVRARAEAALGALAAASGIELGEVARRVRDRAEAVIADGLSALLARRGVDAADAVLVAYGGGGPLHAAGIAGRAGIGRVLVPDHAAVFSALGVSSLDVAHHYPLLVTGPVAPQAVSDMLGAARRDMEAEGFAGSDQHTDLELVDPRRPGVVRWRHAFAAPPTASDLVPLVAELDEVAMEGDLLVLTMTALTPHPDSAPAPADAGEPGRRPVDWGDGPTDTPVIPAASLGDGATVEGPALAAGPDTTVVVPPGWRLTRTSRSGLVVEAVR